MNHTILPDSNVAITELVKQLNTLNFNIVASAAFLFWDILLTFDREMEYIWKSKFSLITVVFGSIRLLAVGSDILFLALGFGVLSVTDSECKGIAWFEALLGLVMSTGSDILLISRVYALYGRNKLLLKVLCILEAGSFVAVLCTVVAVVPQFQVASSPTPFSHQKLHIGSCISPDFPKRLSDVWIPVLCIQTLLFALATGRCLYLQREGPIMISRLYYTFLRDGIWCFFVLFVIYLLCIIGTGVDSILGIISYYWTFPIIGICTSHLILNLRSASDPSQDYSSDNVSRTDTKVNFASGVVASDSTRSDTHDDA